MAMWIETHQEYIARRRLGHIQRRLKWRKEARESRPSTLLRAKNMTRSGYGWEDIALRTGLPGWMVRRLVIRTSRVPGVPL